MDVKSYLENYQKVAYRVFSNAIQKNQFSHAYLLSGTSGIPLMSIAKHLAKSLICQNPSPLACCKCLPCIRIEDENYADLIILDGKEKTIKKGDIEEITSNYSRTAIEANGKMIYILNLVENMTAEAVNSILKFLEEPGNDIYAILTTENEAKVLPTIVSRTQVIRLKLIEQKIIIDEAVKLGVSKEDAEILSNFYNDASLVLDESKNEVYRSFKDALYQFLMAISDSRNNAFYTEQTTIAPLLKKKEDAKLFLDMFTVVFHDIASIKIGNSVILSSYDTILNELCIKLKHIEESLLAIMNARNELDLNLNTALVLDRLTSQITKE